MADESVRTVLIQAIDDAFIGPNWFGPALFSTVRSLSLPQACFRSPYEGYSAWEIILHCAYWTHVVRETLGPEGSVEPFPRVPDDWPALPDEQSEESWEADVALLRAEHARFREAVLSYPEANLLGILPAQKIPAFRFVGSIPAHNTYHTAQIRSLGIKGLRQM